MTAFRRQKGLTLPGNARSPAGADNAPSVTVARVPHRVVWYQRSLSQHSRRDRRAGGRAQRHAVVRPVDPYSLIARRGPDVYFLAVRIGDRGQHPSPSMLRIWIHAYGRPACVLLQGRPLGAHIRVRDRLHRRRHAAGRTDRHAVTQRQRPPQPLDRRHTRAILGRAARIAQAQHNLAGPRTPSARRR